METNYTSPMEGLLHRGDFLHIPPLLLTAHRHEYHNHQKNKLFPAYPNHFDLSERNKVTYTNSQGYIKMHCYAFAEVFSLARTALRCCFLRKALGVHSVAAGKKSRGRAGVSWDLLSRAPSSRPGFTVQCRTQLTQSQPCRRVCVLAWHSMPITISWGRKGFGFVLALRQTGGLGQSLHLCPSSPLMSP